MGHLHQRPLPSSREMLPVIGVGTWRTFDVGGKPDTDRVAVDEEQAAFRCGIGAGQGGHFLIEALIRQVNAEPARIVAEELAHIFQCVGVLGCQGANGGGHRTGLLVTAIAGRRWRVGGIRDF